MHKICLIFLMLTFLLLAACQPVSRSAQQATATAFANVYMIEAMEAAEAGAMALCAVDFNGSPQAYIDNVCAESTILACNVIEEEINLAWEDMQQLYSSRKLACAQSTSRLLEEGRQYGMQVQYWKVNLKGIQGFTEGNTDREYWLQVADENGTWKFNRVLTSGEAALYLTIDKDGE